MTGQNIIRIPAIPRRGFRETLLKCWQVMSNCLEINLLRKWATYFPGMSAANFQWGQTMQYWNAKTQTHFYPLPIVQVKHHLIFRIYSVSDPHRQLYPQVTNYLLYNRLPCLKTARAPGCEKSLMSIKIGRGPKELYHNSLNYSFIFFITFLLELKSRVFLKSNARNRWTSFVLSKLWSM